MLEQITRRETLRTGLTAAGLLALVPEWAVPATTEGETDIAFTDYPKDYKVNANPARGQSFFRYPQNRWPHHAQRPVLLYPTLQPPGDRPEIPTG